MTNKEIIIDGVNVAECDNYKSLFYEYRCGKCDKHPNCYYKQLAREKEKNEKLHEENLKLVKNIDIVAKSLDLLVSRLIEKRDEESKLLHASHVAWNALARLHFILEEQKGVTNANRN